MRISNGSSAGSRIDQKLPNVWDTIYRIEQTLGLSLGSLSEMLELTSKEIEKLRASRKDLPANKVFAFADRLDIGFNSIVNGKIDYQALAHHYNGNKEFVPEKYHHVAFSRRKNALFVLNYVEQFYGWQERLFVLRNFQLNESIFANPDLPISFLFSMDLCEYLNRYKFNDEEMAQIGLKSFLSIDTTPVKNALADSKNVWEIYERMFNGGLLEKHFEKNYEYQILKMDEESCTVSAKPRSILNDMLETKQIGNAAVDTIKRGIAGAYPMLLGLSAASVGLKGASRSDTTLKYQIDFSKANYEMKLRRSRPLQQSLFVH